MGNVVNDSPIGVAIAEMRALGRARRIWAILGAASIVLGLSGPFGTYETLGLTARLAYWSLVCLSTFWAGFFVSITVATWAEETGLAQWPAVALGGVSAGAAVAAIVGLADTAFFGASPLAATLGILPYTLVIAPVLALLFETSGPQARPPAAEVAKADMSWFDRLPPDLGRDLVSIQAQDHYLVVRTTRGEAMVRGRLGEAAEMLGPLGGRVHRSWWLARAHLQGTARDRGKPVLLLRDGTRIPSGRAYRAAAHALLCDTPNTPGHGR